MTNDFRAHVCIATPTYDGRVTVPYLQSFIDHHAQGDIKISYNFLSGDSLITRARNYCLTNFYDSVDKLGLTHLFWHDSDVAFDKGALSKLVDRNVDVVAVPVPLKKGISSNGYIQSCLGPYEEIEPMFYKVNYAATGGLMFSLKAVNAIVEFCNDNDLFWIDGGNKIYDAFRLDISEDKIYLSEDWMICHLLKELGFDIYADSSISCSHSDSSRAVWTRPACPLSENALKEDFETDLPKELITQRWVGAEVDSMKSLPQLGN